MDSNNSLENGSESRAIPPFSARPLRFDRVKVRETEGRGLGVFADARIKKGRAVGRVFGEIKTKEFRSEYCVEFADGVLEPNAPYRFLNHSCAPNCEFVEWEIAEDGAEKGSEKAETPSFELWVHALRDVEPDEELTIDYGWDWQSAIPCKCGAPNCRGWICKEEELELCRQNKGLGTSRAQQ